MAVPGTTKVGFRGWAEIAGLDQSLNGGLHTTPPPPTQPYDSLVPTPEQKLKVYFLEKLNKKGSDLGTHRCSESGREGKVRNTRGLSSNEHT